MITAVIRRLVVGALDAVRSRAKRIVDPYRPERHYMRGRGPRWYAAHEPVPAAAKLLGSGDRGAR